MAFEIFCFQLNSEPPSSELDKRQRIAPTDQQVKMAATEAGSPRRLGLNLNLSVQPHVPAYHWPHSTVAGDTSPSRSKATEEDDDDDDEEEDDDRDVDDDDIECRRDEDCSPEDEQDILEMQVSLFTRFNSVQVGFRNNNDRFIFVVKVNIL